MILKIQTENINLIMALKTKYFPISGKEIFFQIILHVLVFLSYSFRKHQPNIELYQIAFFLNYAGAAFLINYVILPKFFYKKKYLAFLISILLCLAAVILVEELILERIFFPDTRGRGFPGIIYTLLQVLPVILILSGFKFAWDANQKQQEVNQLKAAIEESELQFLKSQINPHFLFNNLNNLYSYAIEQSPKTPDIILELSAVLRYMLYDCREKYVPLSKELEQLENFTRLNQLQIEDRGKVNFKANKVANGYKIAPLILIVFIENAFKHSQASQSENIYINIEVYVPEDGVLNFKCENNFMPASNTESLSKGIGLSNVKKRLQLLYPDAYDLNVQDDENMFKVDLTINLKKVKKS